jgi:hypothetical protein
MLTATRLLECCCLLDHLITDLTTHTADLTTHVLLLVAHMTPPLALQQPRRQWRAAGYTFGRSFPTYSLQLRPPTL